ncbi:class I adenylate-forming enzyme family protein [Mycolicibacterium holsaticum]|uniref:AMP-dependent synthetase n=1 Tax=Mycolicibacterium holsaticum TaxID=152142 RepID=A0A1E3R624_9MYCO|nr:class I adenylate-forming enzyme family protein [Mycolicibacterium holsaticum]ODQ84832.1 hypothetical protein BHQ17_25725 [Mycolicibacterium holsaticum]
MTFNPIVTQKELPMADPDPDTSVETVYSVFREGAEDHPDREFVVHRSARLSWGAVLALVDQCAQAMSRAGVRTGDRVGILCPTRPEASIVLLACAKIGAIYLGMGTRMRRRDMDYLCADACPSIIFAMPDPDLGDHTADIIAAAAEHGLAHPIVLSFTVDGSLSPEFAAFLAGHQAQPTAAFEVDQLDPLAIVYTSGSTGDPKGVVLSHRSLLNYRQLLRRRPLNHPRLISDMPVDHIGYLGNELTTTVLSGGTMLQVPRFDAREVADVIERERATVWMGAIPTMLNRLVALEDFASRDLSSLELVWWAGQLPERTANLVQSFADEVGASYGMSEMCCITLTDPGATPQHAVATVGRPLDDVEVKVLPVPGEQPGGELLLRRTGMMTEYWGKPDKTAEAIDADGWFHTGDLGYVDEGGNLVITGRLKLLIRSGGYNLSPFEIETALESHPGVAMAVVVGLPNEEYGEAAHAAWTPATNATVTSEALRTYLREHLSGFKVPKHFHEFSQLPLLPNGKADRTRIREQLRTSLAEFHDNVATDCKETTHAQ